MNIVICSLNSKYVHVSPAPYNLSAGIRKYSKESHNVFICEATINEDVQDILKRILSFNPYIVGFCTYIWNIGNVKILVKLIKNNSKSKIVLGGPEVSYNAMSVMNENPCVDFVVAGEGELPFALLCDRISQGNSPGDISGVVYRDKDKTVYSPAYISKEKNPVFDIDEYASKINNKIAYIETTRGCPFSCAFCLSGRLDGLKNFDDDICFEYILKLSKARPKIIKFVDRTFNADKKRAKKIIRFICENYGNEIPEGNLFHFELAGDILDKETIELFNNAPKGIFFLEIGMQSFNEKTLSAINRKTNTELLKRNILSLTEAKNVHTHIDLIAGLPFENFDSFKRSFNIGLSLKADVMQLGFLKLLHGADMREKPDEYPCSYSEVPPYEVISTPWLNKREMLVLKNLESAFERFYNSERFPLTNNYLFNKLKLEPFETLCNFGIFLGSYPMPLYEFVNCIYMYFLPFSDKNILRDCLLLDVFSVINMEKIPSLLRVKDKRLKELKSFLNSDVKTAQQKGIKRTVFLLYGEKNGVYIDYNDKTNGKYKVNKIPFEKF